MDRLVRLAVLALGGLLLLSGCALDDDDNPFPNRPASAEEAPVAGTTPAPPSTSATGW